MSWSNPLLSSLTASSASLFMPSLWPGCVSVAFTMHHFLTALRWAFTHQPYTQKRQTHSFTWDIIQPMMCASKKQSLNTGNGRNLKWQSWHIYSCPAKWCIFIVVKECAPLVGWGYYLSIPSINRAKKCGHEIHFSSQSIWYNYANTTPAGFDWFILPL